MTVKLSKSDFNKLRDLLRNYFNAGNAAVSSLSAALAGSPDEMKLRGRINMGWSPSDLAVQVIDQLSIYGKIFRVVRA